VALAIATNQRRVARGLSSTGAAPSLDLTSGDSLAQLPAVLERLGELALRRRLAERGMELFDGRGASRAASALLRRFAATRS
jgi:hypothetical protein